jgi:Leucine-rich repeat (LRR) protein
MEPDTAAVASDQSPAARRSYRLGYASQLLLLILFVACILLAMRLHTARRQHETVAALTKLGGLVHYDYEFDAAGKRVGEPASPIPAWLRNWLGDDFFSNATAVYLGQSRVSDDNLECLQGLGHLHELFLGKLITDDGLEHLQGLTRLETLGLRNTQVSDAGLEHLKGLNVRELYLGNLVTDAGLKHLAGLTQLEKLGLRKTKISDAGLEHLERLTQLHELHCGPRITDAGLEGLQGIHGLTTLDLSHTQITDAGLEHLKKLGNLKSLDLRRTQVTEAAVKQLQQALPQVAIRR